MTLVGKVAVVGLVLGGVLGARAYFVRRTSPLVGPSQESRAASPANAHMDHSPRHGGLVLMNGDTHFEVLLAADGSCRVYFTDAVRAELPASFASEVSVGIATPDQPRETMSLTMDPAGAAWTGRLNTLGDPRAIVRITYVAVGAAPYWMDVPLSAFHPTRAGG